MAIILFASLFTSLWDVPIASIMAMCWSDVPQIVSVGFKIVLDCQGKTDSSPD